MPPRSFARVSHTQAVFLMVAAAFMWSIAGVVTRQVESATRFEIVFGRSAFAALSLLILLPLGRHLSHSGTATAPVEGWALGRFAYRHWGFLPQSPAFWISGVCWSVMFTAFMLAMTYTSVANVLIVMSLGPLFTALLARQVFGQRLPMRTWGAAMAAGAGIVYMYGSQFLSAFADPSTAAAGLVTGALIALCVPMGAAVNWTVVQRSQAHGERIDMVPSVLLGAIISSAVTLPAAIPFSASGYDVAWLALLGLVQLAIPCTLAVLCARVLKAPEVSLLALLEVIFGILLAWLGASERPAFEVLTGGSVVVAALVINELIGWNSRRGTPRIQTLQAQGEQAGVPLPTGEQHEQHH